MNKKQIMKNSSGLVVACICLPGLTGCAIEAQISSNEMDTEKTEKTYTVSSAAGNVYTGLKNANTNSRVFPYVFKKEGKTTVFAGTYVVIEE